MLSLQGWKLLTVCLFGTGKNNDRQVNNYFGTFLKKKADILPIFTSSYYLAKSWTGKIMMDRFFFLILFRRKDSIFQ